MKVILLYRGCEEWAEYECITWGPWIVLEGYESYQAIYLTSDIRDIGEGDLGERHIIMSGPYETYMETYNVCNSANYES